LSSPMIVTPFGRSLHDERSELIGLSTPLLS
jgi:hypothetical protein